MRFAVSAMLVFLGLVCAAQAAPRPRPLALTLTGRRDWDLNALFNTRKGAFAMVAGMTKGFAGGKARAGGPAWQTDTLRVVLTPDAGGNLSGRGRWDAVISAPPGTFGSGGEKTVTLHDLQPVLRGRLAGGRMILPIDMVLQGPDGRHNVYLHLDVAMDWRAGVHQDFSGRDAYGRFAYSATLNAAVAGRAAPMLDDAGLCTASILGSKPRLARAAVMAQCGCYAPRLRAGLAPGDFEGWRQMMTVSVDPSASSMQKGSDVMRIMSARGQNWIDRVDGADRAAQKSCRIRDWN